MSIQDNLSSIQKDIAAACKVAGRNPESVNLVAVSKKQSDARIEEALACGHRFFGENRVQEAYTHWGERRESYPDLKLHLIGPLQTNKAAEAVALFDVIETLDREKLARKLAKEMREQGRQLPCFIQVNTGEEDQKSGILPAELDDFHAFCVRECGLTITGLMCIPPLEEPARLHFGLLAKRAAALGLKELSMGMSGDYEEAIRMGATSIRIGTAFFGNRSE